MGQMTTARCGADTTAASGQIVGRWSIACQAPSTVADPMGYAAADFVRNVETVPQGVAPLRSLVGDQLARGSGQSQFGPN